MSEKTKTQLPPVQTEKTKVKRTRFIVSHGDKGGVGKSFVAQAITDYLYSTKAKVAVIDCDTANPDVARMFESNLTCARTDLRSENGWMDVMDFVVAHPGYTIIMNTPAGIGDYMKNELESLSAFLQEQENPVDMELWWTMNVQHDSVNLLDKAIDEYGMFFKSIRVVCNLHFSNGDKTQNGPFFLWNESTTRAKLDKSKGKTIYFPGLNLRVVKKIFPVEKIMPFSDAADAVSGEKVGLEHAERWKLEQWLKDVSKLMKFAFEE